MATQSVTLPTSFAIASHLKFNQILILEEQFKLLKNYS